MWAMAMEKVATDIYTFENESLCSQTMSDFEIVCIDGGAIDDSGKILDAYSRAASRMIR